MMATAGREPESGVAPVDRHTAQVCDSFVGDDPRARDVLQAAVRHLHAFVTEVGLTREEWRAGIDFLTAVGQRCDEVRQEFILLSDTLGVSMLLEMVNAAPPVGASEPTVLGPFFVDDAAECANGASVVSDPTTGGEALVLSGRVTDIEGRPVAGAAIDVWQVQPSGRYDIEDDPARRNLRGRLRTTPDGAFRFTTVRPVDYTIPDDGPVGSLLRSSGRHAWRPAHVHFRITADGYEPLVTHLFDRASPYLDSDAVFAVRSSLVADMSGPEC
ncbi:MAG TPA: dioxygenase, partial [Acidimicrobiales bacterium]|nr:dioxygenase [Acidimicrobiales bacterium]